MFKVRSSATFAKQQLVWTLTCRKTEKAVGKLDLEWQDLAGRDRPESPRGLAKTQSRRRPISRPISVDGSAKLRRGRRHATGALRRRERRRRP
jgi:hypothetical protein